MGHNNVGLHTFVHDEKSTKTLHYNAREQNSALQKMWGTTMLGFIPLYIVKIKPKNNIKIQGGKTY